MESGFRLSRAAGRRARVGRGREPDCSRASPRGRVGQVREGTHVRPGQIRARQDRFEQVHINQVRVVQRRTWSNGAGVEVRPRVRVNRKLCRATTACADTQDGIDEATAVKLITRPHTGLAKTRLASRETSTAARMVPSHAHLLRSIHSAQAILVTLRRPYPPVQQRI